MLLYEWSVSARLAVDSAPDLYIVGESMYILGKRGAILILSSTVLDFLACTVVWREIHFLLVRVVHAWHYVFP